MATARWRKIGTVGVDAGMVWIGDPCYVIHQSSQQLAQGGMGADWDGFLTLLYDGKNDGSEFDRTGSKEMPLGVAVHSGYGDGAYDVFAKVDASGLVREVKVVFA